MRIIKFCLLIWIVQSCSKQSSNTPPPVAVTKLKATAVTINNKPVNGIAYGTILTPGIQINFNAAIDKNTVANSISVKPAATLNITYQKNDSIIIIKPAAQLPAITKYNLKVSTGCNQHSIQFCRMQWI